MLFPRSRGMKTAPRLWKHAEGCLPLRGRWLRYFLVGVLLLAWVMGLSLGWGDFHVRAYWASSPTWTYPWNNAPRPGLDCQRRMMETFSGEIARTFRLGGLVFEVSQEYRLGSGHLWLEGSDCH